MSQGTGGQNQGNDGGWPTYPGGPSGPDFRPPGSSGTGQPPQGGWTSPGWTQPLQPTGEPAYPPQPGPPGRLPPRPKSPNKRPVIAVIVAIVVLAVVGAAILGAAVLSAGQNEPRPDPTPGPTRSASAQPTQPTQPTPTPEVASDPIPSAPPGEPPTGDLKTRVDARYGTFETIRHTGEGNASFDLPPEAAKSVLWMRTSGPGWYSVKSVFEDTSTTPLIYGDSARDGVVPIGLDRWESKRTIRIEVEARSTWEIEIRPISSVPVFTGEASGRGHAVLISDGPERDVQMDYRGSSNFMVKQYGQEDNSHHANEIGDISVPATFEAGLSVVFVEAWHMGTWGIRPR